MTYTPFLLLSLLIGLVCATFIDVRKHRVPNWLTGSMFLAGLGGALLLEGASGGILSLGGAVVGLLMLIPFYSARAMGAGDVKLLAAAGAFLGPLPTLIAAGFTLLAGATIGLCIAAAKLLSRARYLPTFLGEVMSGATDSNARGSISQHRFPYAIAVTIGVGLALWERGVLEGLLAT